MSLLMTNSETKVGQAFDGAPPKQRRMDSPVDTVNASVTLMPELWSTLPTNLIELIASKLTFSTMIKSRLVCKSWDKIVTSPGVCPTNPAAKCVLLVHNSMDNSLIVHNRSTNSWNSWSYNPLADSTDSTKEIPESECAAHLERTCGGVLPFGLDFIGTAGGLLCFRTTGVFHPVPSFIVSNPVLKTFRNLPSMVSNCEIHNFRARHRVWWGLAAMLFYQETGGYKLVMVGYSDDAVYPTHEDEDSRLTSLKATQVYDSFTDSWKRTYQRNNIRGGWMSFQRSYNKSVLFKGFLFVMTLADIWGGGLSVMIFSMEEGSWVKLSVGPITDEWGPAYGSIAVSNNELYMVATENTSAWSTITYWRLSVADLPTAWKNGYLDQEADSVWQSVRMMSRQSPQFPISDLPWDDTKYWFSVGQNGCIYFMFSIHDAADYDTIVIHDIAADSWTTMQFEGANGFADGESLSSLCLFEPSFAQV